MNLIENEEVIGNLIQINEADMYYLLKFCFYREIQVPITAIPKNKLSKFEGKQIGLLYCNDEFFIRKL